MNRLWVQLSIAFSTVVAISAAMLFAVMLFYGESQRQSAQDDFLLSIRSTVIYGENGIVPRLEAHFATGGTLEDAVSILAEIDRNQPSQPFRLMLQLLSPDDDVIYGRLPANAEFETLTLDNAILRYTITLPPPISRHDSPFLPPETLILLLGVIGTLIGMAASVVLSRRLASPLAALARSVREVGTRDFSLRLQPTGSDEMRDVAYAFNEMVTQLQESERLRSNLVADVTHELRTPLTVMESSLRALIDDVYPLTKTEILTLFDQTRQLSRMVNDLHVLSLADAHQLSIDQHELNINELLLSITDIFRPIAEAEDIRFHIDIPANPLWVSGDRVRLNQVFQNLLVNALRHTPTGGEIALSVQLREASVHTTVTDNGEGIDKKDLIHIFERFYRVDGSRQRSSGGAGLGLAIGKAIVEAHGGQIRVSSRTESPSGTQFSVLLPVSKS